MATILIEEWRQFTQLTLDSLQASDPVDLKKAALVSPLSFLRLDAIHRKPPRLISAVPHLACRRHTVLSSVRHGSRQQRLVRRRS